MQDFSGIRALIIDMDGVLWHGDRPQDGLVEFFQVLRESRFRFVLATNNASLTPEQYVLKLAAMGVDVAIGEILTSSMATASYLLKNYQPAETKIFVIGEGGARQPLLEAGFQLIDLYELGADLVVCGLDRHLSWDKLATASFNLQAGALLVATNGDTSLPTELGFAPGNGATLAALKAASGVEAIVIGKPEPIIYQQAMAILNVDPAETIAIGDRLDTDILGAVKTGIRSAMVLTGISGLEDIQALDYQPTWVFPALSDITEALRGLPIA